VSTFPASRRRTLGRSSRRLLSPCRLKSGSSSRKTATGAGSGASSRSAFFFPYVALLGLLLAAVVRDADERAAG